MKCNPFFRSGENYDRDEVARASGIDCSADAELGTVKQAQQQFATECDINEIVRRFGLTGELPENPRLPQSGDFTGISDFHEAMNAVRAADEAFMEFPAEVRARFDNDPGKMMAFCEDARNREEAIELGFIPRPPERTRDVVTAVDELAAKLVPKT